MNPLLDVPFFAWRNITHQGIRSYLTLLGVVIGIAAIVTLFSLGAGLTNAVNQQFEQLGSNTLYIMPFGLMQGSSSMSTNFKLLDSALVNRIRRIPEVESVLPTIYAQGILRVGREQQPTYITAVTPDDLRAYVDSGFLSLREGRLFESRDVFSVIVGNQLADTSFTKKIRVGSRVEIDGKSFSVVAITLPTSAIAGDPASANNSLFIPDKGFAQLFEVTDPLFLIVKTHTLENVPVAKDKMVRLLEKEFGRDQKVYEVTTSEQLQQQVGALIGVLQMVLVGIASVSLLVGGVGIANTMVMSVLERTSEIGVMKAVGATNELVLSVFLMEAGFIGLVGGFFGLIIGYALAFLIEAVATSAGLALVILIDPLVIVGALFFAVLVGMGAGFFPAQRAAKMDPVDALRGG